MNCGKTVFIVNPHSANGATGREWPTIQKMVQAQLGSFTVEMTTRPGDAAKLTRCHLLNGTDMIITVGGDGTLNEVVNGFMDSTGPIRREAQLGFLPNGTGCDFARSVPIPSSLEASLDIIKGGHSRMIDVGRLDYCDPSGATCTRFFHNITSFGIGGEVDERVNRNSKLFGPFLSFIWSTLISIFLYGKKEVRLRLDDRPEEIHTVWNIAVANGRYHGGSMLVAPDALIDDGLFHITIIGDLTLPEIFRYLPKLYNGTIKDIDKVRTTVARKVQADSKQRVLLDVDGEQPGVLPAAIEIIPAAIRLLTAP